MGAHGRGDDRPARRLGESARPLPRAHGPLLAPALANTGLAELLALASEAEADRQRQRVLRRASAAAMVWPEEAADLFAQGRSLTELRMVGPWTAHKIEEWLRDPPETGVAPMSRRGYMSLAEARRAIATDPRWRSAVRADLQMHTRETDGATSIEEMATAAAALGHHRIAITDHSRTLQVTRGMDEARLLAQGREIDALNARFDHEGTRIRVLKGIEMDLTTDGRGDMEPEALSTLDVILGAFHSQLRRTDDQTARYLAAIERGEIDILAHPRTRMWNRRNGLDADWRRVGEAAADAGIALEIDGSPDRNDLDADTLKAISDIPDLWFAIDTDAHHPDELVFIDIAVGSAITGGVRRDRVINLLEPAELEGWLRDRPRRRLVA